MTADQVLGEAVPAPGDARLFLGGEYVASSGERFEVVSPVTGAVIGTVPVPGAGEIDAAVAAARAAQRAWARVNVWERAKVCHAIGDGITARREGGEAASPPHPWSWRQRWNHRPRSYPDRRGSR